MLPPGPRRTRSTVSRDVVRIAWAALLLSLVVREAWIFLVQSPFDTIYSDMGGYIDRARELVDGTSRVYPRLRAFYPYGTHYVFALLFRTLGEQHTTAVRMVYAAMAAFPAYHFILLSSRLFRQRWVLALLGLLFAVWQPTVWFVGFFISEVPFTFLLFWNAWLAIRFAESRRGGIRLGVTAAVLFTIRPQYILTFALFGVMYLISQRRHLFKRRLKRRAIPAYVRVLVPWLCVLTFSAVRMHRLTGSWGLISENGGLNRVLSDTTYAHIEGHWPTEDGGRYWFWIGAPTKPAVHELDSLVFEGYIGDPKILGDARKAFLADKSAWWRVRRAFRNVQLLYLWNDPWPEQDKREPVWRFALQQGFNIAVRFGVLPLAVIGLFLARRRAALAVIAAHLLTAVGLAMFFFPEARYRCPYDPMLLLLAFTTVAAIYRVARRVIASRRAARLRRASLVRETRVRDEGGRDALPSRGALRSALRGSFDDVPSP